MSIQRSVYLNAPEPALLSVRQPLGIDLDMDVTFLKQNRDPVDPASLLPQLALLPRSEGGAYAYAIEPIPGRLAANVKVPGAALMDPRGYSLEIYQRRAAVAFNDPPVPIGMLAKGALVMDGSAYRRSSILGPVVTPVVVGPAGPTGPAGPQGNPSTVPGPQGVRGSVWTTGQWGSAGLGLRTGR